MNEYLSPVTKVSPTIEIDTIPTSLIIERYNSMNLDVAHFFNGIDSIKIRKCTVTNYRYYAPFNCMGDDQFYQDLQKVSAAYYPVNKWEHKKAIEYINKGNSVLEIGCATGYFLARCEHKGATTIGLELNQKAAKEAISKGLNVKTILLDDFAESTESKFDIICSFQVLEHITEVNAYFTNALKCLKPNGRLIIGVPNNNPYIFKHDKFHTLNLPPHHAGIWDKDSLKKAAIHFNLNIEFIGVSPLIEFKEWYKTQISYFQKRNPILACFMKLIPRPIYKIVLKCFSSKIEGKTLLAVLK
ncbi:MAG: class I SAM-dependent methyltransferase [Sphingobacteriia bacterium]|nr:MAG: class I SAM-dependent methyltransferase [Sphingobacteriia bacterium]TAH09343.1 MAG: class I SAM-dependent methyltransferase [Sphingobacteriia bacterium]